MDTQTLRNCRQCHKKRPPQHYLDYPDHEPSNGPAWTGIRKDYQPRPLDSLDGLDARDTFDEDEDEDGDRRNDDADDADADDADDADDTSRRRWGSPSRTWLVIAAISAGVFIILMMAILPGIRRQQLQMQTQTAGPTPHDETTGKDDVHGAPANPDV